MKRSDFLIQATLSLNKGNCNNTADRVRLAVDQASRLQQEGVVFDPEDNDVSNTLEGMVNDYRREIGVRVELPAEQILRMILEGHRRYRGINSNDIGVK